MASYDQGSAIWSESQQSFPNPRHTEPHIIECRSSVASVEKWLKDAISVEVSRGNKLREAKLNGNRFLGQLNAIDISLPKYRKLNRVKRSSPYKIRNKTNTCSSICDRPFKTSPRSGKGSPKSTYTISGNNSPVNSSVSLKRKTKILKPKRKCTMRLAELAAPTKRHCIETWRNRSNLLPYYMIDRLRLQAVEPRVVELPEAIDYFQTSKQVHKKSREESKFSLKTYMIEAKNVCSWFARKIGKKLRRPLNVILSPVLENLTNVIFDDITKLVKRKKPSIEKIKDNMEIQRDVCRKIAIWIVDVLQESNMKQLEEDLRDLEEEEGPVLDVVDDLVDNALIICEPVADTYYVSNEPSLPTSREVISLLLTDFISSIEDKYFTAVDATQKHDSRNELLTSSKVISSILTNFISSIEDKYAMAENEIELNNIRNEMYDLIETILTSIAFPENKNAEEIIDQIVKHLENDDVFQSKLGEDQSEHLNDFASISSEQLKDFESISSEHLKDFASALSEQTKDFENDADFEYEYQEDFRLKELEIDRGSSETTEQETTRHWIRNQLENILHNTFEDVTLERKNSKLGFFDESENGSKKVKFLIKRMVKDAVDTESTSLQTQPTSYIDLPFTKTFSEPNLFLLSNADEIWPAEINTLKPSFSISRSITSLGKIAETCEIQYISDENSTIRNSDSQSLTDDMLPIPVKEMNTVNTTSAEHKMKEHYTKDDVIPTSDEGGIQQVVDQISTSTATHETEKYIDDLVQDDNTDTNNGGGGVIEPEPNFSVNNTETSNINAIVHKITETLSEIITIQEDRDLLESKRYLSLDNAEISKIYAKAHKIIEPSSKQIDIKYENENVIEHNQDHLSSSYVVKTVSRDSLIDDTPFIKDFDKISVQIPSNEYLQDLLIDMISEEMATDQFKAKEIKPKSGKKHSKHKINKVPSGDQSRADRKSSHTTTPARVKYQWKVQPSAVPSWLERAKGDSEESLQIKRTGTYMLTTSDVEKWCQDLDKAFLNLEMWNDWLKNTRVEISGLQKKRECLCDSLRRKDVSNWIQLKRNIDKDAMVWRKLHQRTQERFQCFNFVGTEAAKKTHCNYISTRQLQPKISSKCQCTNVNFHRTIKTTK